MGLLIAQPSWRAFLLPLVSVGAFGLWGIAERDREAPPAPDDASRARRGPAPATVVQWLAVTVGTAAAVLAAFAPLGALFGSVIS